jgi:hypothetical protein
MLLLAVEDMRLLLQALMEHYGACKKVSLFEKFTIIVKHITKIRKMMAVKLFPSV